MLKSASTVRSILHVHYLYNMLQADLSTIQGPLYLFALPRHVYFGCQTSHQCNLHCR